MGTKLLFQENIQGNFLSNYYSKDSDVFNGNGKFEEKNGIIYEGEWIQGCKTGMAHIKFGNGDLYIGEVKDGKFNGNGQYRSIDGEVYNGQFINGERRGKGQIIKPDGTAID